MRSITLRVVLTAVSSSMGGDSVSDVRVGKAVVGMHMGVGVGRAVGERV